MSLSRAGGFAPALESSHNVRMTGASPRVRVLVLQHGLGALDYRAPDGLKLSPGDIVRVPLGPREILGVVWEA